MAAGSMLGESLGALKRAEARRVPKWVLLWSCAACIVATIAIGFTWGGWVTGRTAAAMAERAALGGQMRLAADMCVDRFITSPGAETRAALLRSAEPWQRGDLIRQGGWLALPGRNDPIPGSADLCIQKILGVSASSG